MSGSVSEWINLALRWFHVIAAIFWIGQTAFFSWLDTRLRIEADGDGNERLWMVHSGGFYKVDKQRRPELVPGVLHWFKWEAALTWASGFLLLLVVYYGGGLLIPYDSPTSLPLARSVGLGSLLVGWLAYDLIWVSPLGRHRRLTGALCLALLVALAWGLCQLLSGRAAYLHVGALLGTIMAANVWMRILPGQRQMLEAVRRGEEPDLTLGRRAKERSSHNTLMAFPVVFLMISHHFPTASYGHRHNWAMLAGFVLVGLAARELVNRWNGRTSGG